MHVPAKQSNRGTAALLAQAQQDYVKARDRVSRVMEFDKWPLIQQITYLLEEADPQRLSREELDGILDAMKSKHWSVLANPKTGVYAQAIRIEKTAGAGQSVVFEMRQKEEEDPVHHVNVAFTRVPRENEPDRKIISVKIEDSSSTAIVLRDAPTLEEMIAWKEQAAVYNRALAQLAALQAGQSLDERTISPLIHEKVHENLTTTVKKKFWFWEKEETVTRTFDEAAAYVGQVENGFEWTQAKNMCESSLAKWVPLLRARSKQLERDQMSSRTFSGIARQLIEQGWEVQTPE